MAFSENRRIMLVGGLLPRNLACEGGGNNSVVQQNPTEATADMPQFGVPGRIYRLHGTREGMVIASPLS